MALSETQLYDPFAELVVVGCAIDTMTGATLAHQRLEPADFYDPVLADLFAAAPTLPPLTVDECGTQHGPRRTHAAHAAGMRVADVADLCDLRPVMCDTGGRYAKRVARASHWRLVATLVGDAAQAVADDQPDEAADRLRAALALLETAP